MGVEFGELDCLSKGAAQWGDETWRPDSRRFAVGAPRGEEGRSGEGGRVELRGRERHDWRGRGHGHRPWGYRSRIYGVRLTMGRMMVTH